MVYDVPSGPDTGSMYECLRCGRIVRSETHPGECTGCGGIVQGRGMSLE